MQPGLRIRSIQAPIIPVVAELIRKYPGTISLGQGVVHYKPPATILERVQQGILDPGLHTYGHVAGTGSLLDLLSTKLEQENEISLSRREIVVTAGANMGFVNAILAITDPGDEIILPMPYYFNQEMAIGIADCRVVLVPTDHEYQLDIEALRRAITSRTRAIVTISPNNPTGAVYSETSLRKVNELCAENGIFHISDEAYEYFTYGDKRHFSPGSIRGSEEYTISLFSFSKAYGMAGWRIGYMVIPRFLMDSIKKIQDTLLICPPLPSQVAAEAALTIGPQYCRAYVNELAETRTLVLDHLATLGNAITVPPAYGAFYLFIQVHTDWHDMELVEFLIREYRVAVIPGSTFGASDRCYLRVAYGALQKETVREAVGRLVQGLHYLL